MSTLEINHNVIHVEPNPDVVRDAQRFALLKIAFREALAVETAGTALEVAKTVVEYADAVLAEMEKETETEPDKND